jgi:hypothetical protein
VHIYDYAGWDYDSFLLNTDYNKTFIFCTSEKRKSRLTEKNNFPGDHIFVAFPPVDTALWSSRLKEVKYKFVHVGNFNPITGSDDIKVRFDNAIRYFKVGIWGSGWGAKNELHHGKAALFRVSSIYAKSEFALGLMYPFQREVTFSGRFWHAPLNGCYLLSEPGLYSGKIPGIIETDYSIEDISRKTAGSFNRKEMQVEALAYWENQNSITIGYIKPTLMMMENNFSLIKSVIYLQFRSSDILIKLYQKTKGWVKP